MTLIHALPIESIEETIELYSITKERFKQPIDLLESVAGDIAHSILNKHSKACEVSISITETAPNLNSKPGVALVVKRGKPSKSME